MTDTDLPTDTARIYQRDLGIITALCAGALLTTVIFVSAPVWDLWASGLFADGAEGFPLRKHWLALFFNDFIEWVAIVIGLFALGGLGYTLVRNVPFWNLRPPQFSFLALSLIIGPGLIANALFKENWGRARPRQITEFGGSQDFSPPLVITDQCASNCSFVSGDASMGFAVLAVALLLPAAGGAWVRAAIAFGIFIGGVRIVQGAHFLSDVIFAGIFVCLAIMVLKMVILDRRWGVAEAMETRAAALPGPMGLEHDQSAQAWREAAFAPYRQADWRTRLWLFFRAQPKDFGLADPAQPPTETPGADGAR